MLAFYTVTAPHIFGVSHSGGPRRYGGWFVFVAGNISYVLTLVQVSYNPVCSANRYSNNLSTNHCSIPVNVFHRAQSFFIAHRMRARSIVSFPCLLDQHTVS